MGRKTAHGGVQIWLRPRQQLLPSSLRVRWRAWRGLSCAGPARIAWTLHRGSLACVYSHPGAHHLRHRALVRAARHVRHEPSPVLAFPLPSRYRPQRARQRVLPRPRVPPTPPRSKPLGAGLLLSPAARAAASHAAPMSAAQGSAPIPATPLRDVDEEAAAEDEDSAPACPYCLEPAGARSIRAPCRCRGSLGLVHEECLRHDLSVRRRGWDAPPNAPR